MLEHLLIGTAATVIGLTYYTIKKELKDIIDREKEKLESLDLENRLEYLKKRARTLKMRFLTENDPRAIRTVAKEMLNEKGFEEVLKIMYPGLEHIEDWRRFCSTSNIFQRYHFKGQY